MKRKKKIVGICLIALVTFGIVGAKVRSNACGVGEEQTGIIDTAPVITQTPTQTPEQVVTKTPEQVAKKTPEQVATKTPEQVATQTPEQVATQTPEQVATKTPEQVATQTPVQVATQTPTYGENEQEQVEVTTELEPTCAVEQQEKNDEPEVTPTVKDKKDLDSSPKTADSSNIYFAIIALVVSGIIVVGIYCKKKMKRY